MAPRQCHVGCRELESAHWARPGGRSRCVDQDGRDLTDDYGRDFVVDGQVPLLDRYGRPFDR